MTEHPITPPTELVRQWHQEWMDKSFNEKVDVRGMHIATQAARWGADVELRQCINELYMGVGTRHISFGSNRESLCSDLRAARRPKPLSKKQRALKALSQIEDQFLSAELAAEIRCALEELPDD